ncbi:non-ribosomal peptide synthetase family protein [Gordonia insulae]|uniref:Diacylglycerol O-acyltransferase n=1 Tax=Gordonia insulae TaxID=2420509 RepID=A0A3G8JIR8_9ACTN|nr:hypothetical protein [Gordonia insulae]AZG44838.1 hypothetical protein D7316_01429 [Gordonia insulae]
MTSYVERTTHDDDLFIRMDRAFGVPVLSQAIWRLTEPLSAAELERIGRRLLESPISRRLHRSRLPFVRDHWTAAGDAAGRTHLDPPLADDEILDWIERAADVRFDLANGPVWELRAAPLASGGGMVTLCSSHAVGDGWLGGRAIMQATAPDDTLADAYAPATPSLSDNVRDALGQLRSIGAGLAGLVRDGRATRHEVPAAEFVAPVTSLSTPRPPEPSSDEMARENPIRTPLTIVAIPGDDWRATFANAGGTSNALFVAIVIGLIVESGRATWEDRVRVSVPMSLRPVEDTRANSTTGLTLDVPAALSRDRDLAAIRTLAKDAYRAAGEKSSRLLRLQPLMQALPDAAVNALSRNAATPLALASNGGVVDPGFAGLGEPSRVETFASRATTQGVSRERLIRLRGGLAAWFHDTGHTTTLAVSGLDPVAFPTSHELATSVEKECARWGLTAQKW